MMLPELETERLQLLPLQLSDVEVVFELDSNPRVMRYIGDGPRERADVEAYVAKRAQMGADGLGVWTAWEKTTKDFVGLFLLVHLDNTEEIEIGYRLIPAKWNNAYATEGAAKILNYAFYNLNIERLVAVAFPENIASRKVMEHIGMRFEKTAFFYGKDLVYYSLKKP